MTTGNELKKRIRTYMEKHPDMNYTTALRELTHRRLDQEADRPSHCDSETGYHAIPHVGCILQ